MILSGRPENTAVSTCMCRHGVFMRLLIGDPRSGDRVCITTARLHTDVIMLQKITTQLFIERSSQYSIEEEHTFLCYAPLCNTLSVGIML